MHAGGGGQNDQGAREGSDKVSRRGLLDVGSHREGHFGGPTGGGGGGGHAHG